MTESTSRKEVTDNKDGGNKSLAYCPKYGLHESMVPEDCRERFITTGYRCESLTALECVKTVSVYGCNETLNIWTHLIPFMLFLIKFIHLFTTELSLQDPFYWPLAADLIGIMGFCITSSCAHIFCALSPVARYTCFYFDYAVICVYSATGWQAYYFYSRPLDESSNTLLENTNLMMLICMKITLIGTFQSCCSRHVKNVMEHLLRVSSFVVPWLCASSAYLYRLHACETPFDCDFSAVSMFAKSLVVNVVGALCLATKFPERLSPGKFDFIGHSHQIMHICVAIGGFYQFESSKLEMLRREDRLRKEWINQNYSSDCLYFTLAVIAANFSIAFFFGPVKRYYDSNLKTKTL